MENFTITNYDVLLTVEGDGKLSLTERDHVGNRRFEVLLDIHRDSYHLALSHNGEAERERVVETIVSVVCTECVPNGRFLLRSQGNPFSGEAGGWRQLPQSEAKMAIHQLLVNRIGTEISSSLGISNPLQAPFHRPLSQSLPAGRNHFSFQRSVSDSRIFYSPMPASATTANRSNRSQSLHNGINASHLSSSLTMMPPIFPPPLVPQHNHDTIPETSMDVVVAPSGNSIAPSTHAGNNRFRVLIELQSPTFHQKSKPEKQKIVDDIYRAVTEHWSSRFVVETELEGYQTLSEQLAKNCIWIILGDTPGLADVRSREVQLLKERKLKRDLKKMNSDPKAFGRSTSS